MTLDKSAILNLETSATYKIGKTTVLVNRIFREKNAETVNDILVKLIKIEVENPDK